MTEKNQPSISDVFRSSDFRALRVCLDLRPSFKTWPLDALMAYQEAVLDELVEEERLFHQNAVISALNARNRNRKNGIDVFETPDNNLSIPFE